MEVGQGPNWGCSTKEKKNPPNIIRLIKLKRIRWAWHVARTWKKGNVCRILVGTPEGSIPLGTCRRKWEDNIKIGLREMVWDNMDWINLAQNRDQWRTLVSTLIPSGSIKCWKILE
jgi:hypothetical protein